MGYRADFIKKFGELFTADAVRKHYEGCGIEFMELDEEREIVTVHFVGGKEKYFDDFENQRVLAAYPMEVIR